MQAFAPPPPAQNQPFAWGPFIVRPSVLYEFTYGNGILVAPAQPQNTIVQEFSPGIALQAGSHWTLNYAPTFNFYSSSAFRNSVDQSAQLQWGTSWRNWFLSASQGYVYTDFPEVQTAGQTALQTYSTAVNAVYQMNDRLSLSMGLDQTLNYTGGNTQNSTNLLLALGNSQTWSTMDWLNDQFWPRLNAGIGVGLGFSQQQNSPNSIDEQYQAQLNWRVTEKISFQLSGGLEQQQYWGGSVLGGSAGSLLTPIFSAAVQYQPFERTSISLSGSRTVGTSEFEYENVETTSIMAGINQRLLGKLHLDLSGAYSTDNYVALVSGLSTSRNDDIYTFNASLSCPFLKRGTCSIFYQYSEDASKQSGFTAGSTAFGYFTHQVGFAISYAY